MNLPPRKRQKISPNDPMNPSQDDPTAQDEIESSQGSSLKRKHAYSSQARSQEAREKRMREIEAALTQGSGGVDKENQLVTSSSSSRTASKELSACSQEDPENPFISKAPLFASAKTLEVNQISNFTSAFQVASAPSLRNPQFHDRSPSPDPAPIQDYSTWFDPGPVDSTGPVGFQSATSLPGSSTSAFGDVSMTSFVKASRKEFVIPSAAAFEKARKIMEEISREEGENTGTSEAAQFVTTSAGLPQSPLPDISSRFSHPPPTFSSPLSGLEGFRTQTRAKQFRSPLLASVSPASQRHIGSSHNPTRPPGLTFAPASAHRPHPLSSQPINALAFSTPTRPNPATPAKPSASFAPVRPVTSARFHANSKPTAPKFVTPFKPGMRPGDPGRVVLTLTPSKPATISAPVSSGGLAPNLPILDRRGVFNLTPPPGRTTLAESGFFPSSYGEEELQIMGINTDELRMITPTLAVYYCFNTLSTPPASGSRVQALGPADALAELLSLGCSLVTKPWVDNHYALILWKLAGMVCLDPDRESTTHRRWCWSSVINQLLYRYEKELNTASRPPLRLITTQDAPASCPMILCVSGITWSERTQDAEGIVIEEHPELEVTDGWYRLRAQVDAPMARAVRRGIIQIGRKIAVAGARTWSERKDPSDILDAYNSVKLVLSGNSSHLAPWHAKLGWSLNLPTVTLHKLTPDGGVVIGMDIVVVATYPLAFIEFIEDEDGNKHREGPRNATDEAKAQEAWKQRYEVEESKIRVEFEKRFGKFEGYVDRLERKAGERFQPGEEDSPPDYIDNLYDDLESAADANHIIEGINHEDAGWLARYMRERIEKDREKSQEEVELKGICPPREVRNFRIIIVQDACKQRRPSHRQAQVTVWNVLGLSFVEGGKEGAFEVGQRFRVTNLMPSQPSAWMDRDESGAEIFLSTRRDSRWTLIN